MLTKKGVKFFTAALMSLFGFIPMSAQFAVKMIPAEGEETTFLLSHHPKVSMAEEGLIIETDQDRVECEIGEGVRFEFIEDYETAVKNIETGMPAFKFDGQGISGYNIQPSSDVMIFDVSGKVMKSSRTDADGNFYISLSGLPEGVYILNSVDKKFKFIKK